MRCSMVTILCLFLAGCGATGRSSGGGSRESEQAGRANTGVGETQITPGIREACFYNTEDELVQGLMAYDARRDGGAQKFEEIDAQPERCRGHCAGTAPPCFEIPGDIYGGTVCTGADQACVQLCVHCTLTMIDAVWP